MRLAVISDIHGNLHALQAVLRDIRRMGADEVIVNGDLVNRGPNNVAVLECLLAGAYRFLLGNHDDLMLKWVVTSSDLPQDWFNDPFWEATAWSARGIEQAGLLDSLRNLPMTYRVTLEDAPTLLFSHGSPRHYREGYGEHLPNEALAEILQHHPADILIGSHTHKPLERRFGRHLILNTGAVGSPFNGDPRAQYLLLTLERGAWQHAFRAVAYDHKGALEAFETSGLLQEGGLSARIFFEELRLARPLYAKYWMWTETEGRAKDWESWEGFKKTFPSMFVNPSTGE